MRLHVVLLEIEHHAIAIVENAVLGRGRSSLESQKSIECRAISSNGIFGSPFEPSRQRFAANLRAMRGRAHLDEAERIIPIVRAEIVIADCERLLKHGVVRLAHQGHQDRLVMAHVVASDLVGAIGQTFGWLSLADRSNSSADDRAPQATTTISAEYVPRGHLG